MLYSKRVRKKKRLTDPVVIIPFPEQQLKDQIAKIVAPKAHVQSITTYEKPEAKILAVPTGQLNTANVSIKKVMEPMQQSDASRDPALAKDLPKEKFTLDQAKMAWRRYAFEVKAKRMETFYHAMIKRDPKIKDDVHFTMDVDNQVQIDYMMPHLQDLIGFLRQELKNYDITLDFSLTEDKESEVKFLTGKDRFAAMARKNPNLHSFKTIFNLDIEF